MLKLTKLMQGSIIVITIILSASAMLCMAAVAYLQWRYAGRVIPALIWVIAFTILAYTVHNLKKKFKKELI